MALQHRFGHWQARYTGPDGRPVSKSTGVKGTDRASKKRAEGLCTLWAEEARKIRDGEVKPEDLALRSNELAPIAQHLDAYQAHQQFGKNNKTKTCNEHRNLFDDFCEQTGAAKNIDITPVRVTAYLRHCAEKHNNCVTTTNGKLGDFKALTKWMVESGLMRTDPLIHQKKARNTGDPRNKKRPPTNEEISYLLAHTIAKGNDKPHMTGPKRAIMYLTSLITGYRAGEIAKLTRDDFSLDGLDPSIKAKRSYTKNGQEAIQPIAAAVASALHHLVNETPAGERVFYGAADNKPGKFLKADLESAREAWVNETNDPAEFMRRSKSDFLKRVDSQGHKFYFHSLRHKYINDLSRAGVPVDFIRKLARHGELKTTENYLHTTQADVRGFAPELPSGIKLLLDATFDQAEKPPAAAA